MEPGRRAHYRVDVEEAAGLHVAVQTTEGAPIEGLLINVSASGAGVRFTGPGRPNLVVGQEIDLIFTYEKLGDLTVVARVQHRTEEEGARRYGFRFLQPQQLNAHLTRALRGYFNRRRALRVAPDPARPVKVVLDAGEGAPPVEVRLENLSPLGAGISLEVELETTFARTTIVGVSISLPDRRQPFDLIGYICYRRLVGTRIFYGIEFDPEASEEFDQKQEFIARYASKRERQLLRKSA